MTETITHPVTTAYIRGEELVLEDFVDRDPDVVSFVREAEDIEVAVHRCLEMGARALRLAGATLDTQLVEHRFDAMATQLDRSVDAFAQSVDATAEKLLGEDSGVLRTALTGWLEDVTATLDSTFDETSKRSAIAKLETVLESARAEQVKSMRRLLDPDNEESPLAAWRRDIVTTVERQGKTLESAIGDLRAQLAIDEARAEERELGTQKGRDFEQVVVDQVTEIVRHLEDTVEHTGDDAGSAGTKVGDVVVTTTDHGRYVLEVKDKPLTLKAALTELEQAMANRDAGAAVMVFARSNQSPVRSPFQWFDSKALVVLDKDALDPHALRLACLWARWIVSRRDAEVHDAFDAGRVRTLIESTHLALKTATTIKGSHTKAKKAIDDAGRQLVELVDDLNSFLDELEEQVAGC